MGLACKLVMISDITGAKQFKRMLDAVTMTVSTDRLITREKRSLIATLATTATIARVDLRVFSTVYTRLPKGHHRLHRTKEAQAPAQAPARHFQFPLSLLSFLFFRFYFPVQMSIG